MPFSFVLFLIIFELIVITDIFPYVINIYKLNDFIVFFSPFFLFFLAKIERKKTYLPIKTTYFYFLFFIFSTISSCFAIDKEIAFKKLFLYISYYFFFIFAWNNQDYLERYFKKFLLMILIFFIALFSINYFFKLNLFYDGGSIFYNYDHNQIGNFLVLGFIITFPNLLSIIFFIFIMLSYSRTSYLILIFTPFFKLLTNKIEKKSIFIGFFIIFSSIFFLFLTTKNLYLTKNKKIFGLRNIYFSYALSSIKEKPFFGVGPGNFYFSVLKRQLNSGETTTTSHNIFLEILAENGILAGLFFSLFVLSFLFKSKRNINFLLFLALLLIFMLDFSYIFNTFIILWFIIGGLILSPKEKKEINLVFPSLIIFVFGQIILISQILLNRNFWRQSLFIYPMQKKSYELAIEENIRKKSIDQAYYYLKKYNQLFKQNYYAVLNQINYYSNPLLNDKKKLIELYERLILLKPIDEIDNLRKLRYLYTEHYGPIKAREKMSVLLKTIKSNILSNDKKSELYNQINSFCIKAKLGC